MKIEKKHRYQNKIRNKDKSIENSCLSKNIDNVNTVMRESILGVKVIKAFAIENTQKSRFIEANEELTNTSIKSQNMNLILWPMAT